MARSDVKSLGLFLSLPLAASAFGQVNLLDADPNSPTFNNPSFESPDTTFVSIVADKWELTGPKSIVDIPPFGSVPIIAGCGIFANPDDSRHLAGADGSQLAYIFGNSFTSQEPGDSTVDHAFTQHTQLTLAAAKEYELTIAFANAQSVPGPECALTMSLFAFDSSNPSAESLLASKTITSAELDTVTLTDFPVFTAPVSGATIGKQVGIRVSTHSPVSPFPGGGQFDFDNVRLSIAEPGLYWDGNGAISGAGNSPAGTWGASSNWTSSAGGTSPTAAYTGDASTAVFFSAGVDAKGAFTVTVSGTQSAESLNFQEGDVTLAGGQIVIASGVINVAGGSSASISSTITSAAGLHKTGAGLLALEADVTTASSISIAAGTLDLKDNKLIATADSIGTWTGSAYDGITGLVASNKITSTSATSTLTGLAVSTAEAAGKLIFGGQSVSGSDVLVMFTYVGDADLSGDIDGDDFAAIDGGYSSQLTGYANGDFNYSGSIDADDYWFIDRNFSKNLPALSASANVTAVPEPAASLLCVIFTTAPFTRRRR